MRILQKREKTILYIAVAAVGISALYNLFVRPVAVRYSRLKREIALAEKKLTEYRTLVKYKDKLLEQFNTEFASIPVVSSSKESSLVGALSELEGLAENAQIKILDIRPQGFSKGAALYKEAAIEIRSEGSTENFMKFLYNIENSPFLLRIRRFQLTVRPDTQTLEGAFVLSLVAASAE